MEKRRAYGLALTCWEILKLKVLGLMACSPWWRDECLGGREAPLTGEMTGSVTVEGYHSYIG